MGASVLFISRTTSSRPFMFGTRDERLAQFVSGKTPPFSAVHEISSRGHVEGFANTVDPRWRESAARDPLFNEFLRPNDLSCRYAASLLRFGNSGISLNVIRSERLPQYEADDLSEFKMLLPYFQAATILARDLGVRDARIQAEPFHRRGEPVFSLSFDGTVVEMNAAAEAALTGPLRLARGRLAAVVAGDQHKVDGAIRRSIYGLQPSIQRIDDGSGSQRILLLALPVVADARDVFCRTSAILVLVDTARRVGFSDEFRSRLSESFGLTPREAEVAGLVATGLNLAVVARRLNMALGTARVHLKSAMSKIDVHSQAELAALVARLC
jgi:DNA-binding CsgD family transcriptional regulator